MIRKAAGYTGIISFSIIATACFAAPLFFHLDPFTPTSNVLSAPNLKHLLGTNELGQDIFSRLLYGGRNSLITALSGAIFSAGAGTMLGITGGYLGGATDRVISGFTDIMLVMPIFPMLILISLYWSPSVWLLGLTMGMTGWGTCARIIRSQTRTLRQWDFVQGAVALGASNLYIMRKYILPFVLPLAVVKTVLGIQRYLLMSVGLSFIGLGSSRCPDWGQMLHNAYANGAIGLGCWWLLAAPAGAVVLSSFSMTLTGYSMENRLEPMLNREK